MSYPFMEGTHEATQFATLMDQCDKFSRMGWSDAANGKPAEVQLTPFAHLQRMYDHGFAAGLDARRVCAGVVMGRREYFAQRVEGLACVLRLKQQKHTRSRVAVCDTMEQAEDLAERLNLTI